VNNPADLMQNNKGGKFNVMNPLKKIKNPKEIFDKMESEFY